nr:hypothetical protein [Paenibacillus periandrae]
MVTAWQKEARKWIVKAQRELKRRSWREKKQQTTGREPNPFHSKWYVILTGLTPEIPQSPPIHLRKLRRGYVSYPEYYKGVHSYEYRVQDRLGVKEVEGG